MEKTRDAIVKYYLSRLLWVNIFMLPIIFNVLMIYFSINHKPLNWIKSKWYPCWLNDINKTHLWMIVCFSVAVKWTSRNQEKKGGGQRWRQEAQEVKDGQGRRPDTERSIQVCGNPAHEGKSVLGFLGGAIYKSKLLLLLKHLSRTSICE